TYAHDAAGHRTAETIAGNTIQYVYDGFARPASRTQPAMTIQQSHGATVSLPAGTWSYGHDGMGRRTFKRAPGNVLTRFLHGAEGNLLAETSPGGTSLTSIYLWLNGQPIGLVRGGQVYHVHADHLGRPEILTNTSKAIVWRAENLAFDRKVATTSIGEYNLGFPGQYYDAEGASWQNWFRTYDGSIGRYTQSDPIGLAGGLNTYAYVGGNSVNFQDSTGLVRWQGTYYTWGAGYRVGGVGRSTFTLTSDCVNGQQALIQVSARGVGAALGLSPIINTGGSIAFDDGLATIDPGVFNGDFLSVSFGTSIGIGFGYSKVRLGSVVSEGGWSLQGGFNPGSASEIFGSAQVTKAAFLECERRCGK
ncbi:MAG TPA: RHS repeat-associated core domain-containing protein, partial [Promineifilum sp.]|nr:RHS repeat-associated core domain-containing protein [Promineifilum sp.]